MLAGEMRPAGWCLCVIACAACGGRPLSPPDGAPDATADAGIAPGAVVAAVPAGAADPTGGSSDVGAVVALDDGGVVVAGTFSGTVSFASDKILTAVGGVHDGFLARYRRDTRLVWVQPFAVQGGNVVISGAAALPGDETVVAGWFSGSLSLTSAPAPTMVSAGGLDGFVARFASDGSLRWIVRAGGPGDDIIRGVSATATYVGKQGLATGLIAIAGAAGAGAVFGPGEARETTIPASDGPIFVASLSLADGTLSWVRFAGGGVPSQAYGVAVDPATADVAITGYANGPAIFGAGMPDATTLDPANGRAIVAQWNVDGDFLWARGLGGAAGEGDATVFGKDGSTLVTGTFEGTWGTPTMVGPSALTADTPGQPGCFIAKLAAGSASWIRRLTGRGLRPWRLHLTASGDLLVASSFGGGVTVDPDGPAPATVHSAGDDDALFVRLYPSGALRWATAMGGLGDDEGNDVVEASDGYVWGVGRYVGPAQFGTGAGAITLGSGTDGSGFLVRLAP